VPLAPWRRGIILWPDRLREPFEMPEVVVDMLHAGKRDTELEGGGRPMNA